MYGPSTLSSRRVPPDPDDVVTGGRMRWRERGNRVRKGGKLLDGRMIAVKRLNQSTLTKKDEKGFVREVELMPRVRHGIAHGVAYLHEGSNECVVHRDLKPPNVLLDENFRPRISDFGTAKMFVADPTDRSDLTIVGSRGYASPEYLQGELTTNATFTAILLESLSGQRMVAWAVFFHIIIIIKLADKANRFCMQAWELWEQDSARSLDRMVDPHPPASDSEIGGELARCVQIGLLCVQNWQKRPIMSVVVAMLTSNSSGSISRRGQSFAASASAPGPRRCVGRARISWTPPRPISRSTVAGPANSGSESN
uniref:Protein kinase domain-containing protein n=1 Tax=Leersia perrieri TaxID=77586 RepID=A0A0D9WA02_9ORYZ